VELSGPDQRRTAADLLFGDGHADAVPAQYLHCVERGLLLAQVVHAADKEPDRCLHGAVRLDHVGNLFEERCRRPRDGAAGLFNKCRDLLMPGQGETLPVCERPQLLDRFSRDLDLFGAGHKAGLAARAGEKPVRTASGTRSPVSRGSSASRISCRIAVGPRKLVTSMAGQTETHARHSMQSRSGLISSICAFVGSCMASPCAGTSDAIVAIFGRRSTTRSFLIGRFSGAIVMSSVASFMHASTGSPSTRTAQLPHCPDPQQYRYESVGSISSWIACRTCRTRAPSLMRTVYVSGCGAGSFLGSNRRTVTRRSFTRSPRA